MPADVSIWTFAGLTAAVGMGVVFVALFLLSVYMHYFKSVTARLERRAATPAPTPPRPPRRPAPAPLPPQESVRDDAGARVAAAVALGLHLEGAGGAPTGEVAAAIATALELHRGRAGLAGHERSGPASGWKLAGRVEAMALRSRRHERPRSR